MFGSFVHFDIYEYVVLKSGASPSRYFITQFHISCAQLLLGHALLCCVFSCCFTSKARPHCEIVVIDPEEVLGFRDRALRDVGAPF